MTDEQVEAELIDIAYTANRRVNGGFTAASDDISALHLVDRLARLMLERIKNPDEE